MLLLLLMMIIIIIIGGAATKEGMRHNNRHLNRSRCNVGSWRPDLVTGDRQAARRPWV